MQLNLKNFTGVDNQGNQYRIWLETENDETIIARKQIKVNGKWENSPVDVIYEAYHDNKPFPVALKTALYWLGRYTGLQLIKDNPEPLLKTA